MIARLPRFSRALWSPCRQLVQKLCAFSPVPLSQVCVCFFFNFGAIDCICLWNLLVDLEILTMFRYHNGAQYADGEVLSTH